MRDLYKALTLIAVDVPLRDAVIAAHGMDDRPELLRSASCMPKPPHNLRWERQPNLPRLDQIDQLFRAKSVFMTAYELSEINRWVHEPGFAGALENFRTALPNGVRTAAEQQQPALWEAIGVLVVDPDLCDRLTANVENLTMTASPLASRKRIA